MPAAAAATVGPDQLRLFDECGWFVIAGALPPADLSLLRALCDEAVAGRAAGDAVGDLEGHQLMDTSTGRTFVFNLEAERQEMYQALLSDWAAAILAPLTADAYLFHSEFVVKVRLAVASC